LTSPSFRRRGHSPFFRCVFVLSSLLLRAFVSCSRFIFLQQLFSPRLRFSHPPRRIHRSSTLPIPLSRLSRSLVSSQLVDSRRLSHRSGDGEGCDSSRVGPGSGVCQVPPGSSLSPFLSSVLLCFSKLSRHGQAHSSTRRHLLRCTGHASNGSGRCIEKNTATRRNDDDDVL
jgi:hypothetical protein